MTEPSPPERPGLTPPRDGESHSSRRLLLLAIVLIALGGGGLFAWDWLSRGETNKLFVKPLPQVTNRNTLAETAAPPPPSTAVPSPSPSSDQLSARVAELEARLAQVAPPPAQPAPPSAADPQVTQLQAEVASLETALSVERSRAARAEAAVQNANQRLQTALKVATALAHLRTSLDRGYPFEHEFDETSAVFSGDADMLVRLQPLHQWAESGIATSADLRTALEALGSDIVRAALLEGPKTWWQEIVARVKSLIVVRPTPDGDIPQAGTEDGDKPAAIVARAEAKLSDDDVAGAINELSALKGAAADVAEAWMATARARVTADETMAALDEALRTLSSEPPLDAKKEKPPTGGSQNNDAASGSDSPNGTAPAQNPSSGGTP